MKTIIPWLSIIATCATAHAQVSPGSNNHSFQYLTGVLTSTARVTTPVTASWNAVAPPKWYTMAVTTTGSGFVVVLEGSVDQLNWSTIATQSTVGASSNTVPLPSIYFRMRAVTIGASTSVTGTAIGVW